MIETYGLPEIVEACRKFAIHECFASLFTIQERLQIDSYLKERQDQTMKANAGEATRPEDIQGKPQPVAGKYHVQITECNDSRVRKDGTPLHNTIFQLEVLDGTVPGQVGKEMPWFVRLGENGEETDEYCGIIGRLCLATGLIAGKGQSGYIPGGRDVQPEEFAGQQCVIEWEEWSSKGKHGFQVANRGLAVWSVDSPEIADVPKNLAAVKLWRDSRAANTPPAQQNPPAGTVTGGQTDLLL